MKTKYLVTAFVITAIAQLFIPAQMVYNNHITETQGALYKFKAKPVDPADPFRGRYITLNFEADTVALSGIYVPEEGSEIYALLDKDAQGYARIKSVQYKKPQKGDFIKAQVNFYSKHNTTLYLDLPFERYYMEETKAPEAERLYARYSRDENMLPAYGVVAVKDGNTVLKNVMVNGIPIEEYVKNERK